MDKGIDRLVYELYGLTKDEIKIVESRNQKRPCTRAFLIILLSQKKSAALIPAHLCQSLLFMTLVLY